MQKLPLRFSSNGISLPSKNKVIGEVEESTAKSKLPMKEKKTGMEKFLSDISVLV